MNNEQESAHEFPHWEIKKDDISKGPNAGCQEDLGDVPPATIVLLIVVQVGNIINQEIHKAHEEKIRFIVKKHVHGISDPRAQEKTCCHGEAEQTNVSYQQNKLPNRNLEANIFKHVSSSVAAIPEQAIIARNDQGF